MRQDSRLSRVLHVLLHMQDAGAPMTSEDISRMLGTNPAVVRRTMGGLRSAGYVSSEKGHGGGWTLIRPLSEISLLDVYRALGCPELFALGLSNDSPACLVERSVNSALNDNLRAAERLILDRFAEIKLSHIARDFASGHSI